MMKHKKFTTDRAIYTKVFYYGTVSYLTVYTDDLLNTTNNKTSFPECRSVFEDAFDIKFQEG